MKVEFFVDDDMFNKLRIFTCPSRYIFKHLKLHLATQNSAKKLYNRAYLVYDTLVYLKIV